MDNPGGAGNPQGNVVRVDAESLHFESTWPVLPLRADESLRGLAPFARSLWRIDARTNAVERIRMTYPPVGVTASGDEVWVTVGDDEFTKDS